MEHRVHVVVGDGATAAAFASHVDLRAGDELVVVGPNVAQLGRGLAYGDHPPEAPWRYAYLLNSPNEVVDADFVDWLSARWSDIHAKMAHHQPRWLSFGADHIAAQDLGALFAPRAVFGDWVEEVSTAKLAGLQQRGVQVRRCAACVTRLDQTEGRFHVALSTGEQIVANSVDVATGGAANTGFGSDEGGSSFPALYGYEADIAAALTPGEVVTCVGGNAAMLDVLRLLQSLIPEDQIRLRVISQGKAPEPLMLHRPRRRQVEPRLSGPFATADDFFEALDADIATFRSSGATISELRPGYSAWLDRVGFEALVPDAGQRRRAQRKLEGRFRRGTQDSLADYQRLKQAGQIEEVAGTVHDITVAHPSGATITYRAEDEVKRLWAPLVINTSGPRGELVLDDFTAGLTVQGWLRLNGSKTGIVVRDGLQTEVPGMRYLSPAVTEIGAEIIALPLYDVARLWKRIKAASNPAAPL